MEKCLSKQYKKQKETRMLFPWRTTFNHIKQRCNNKKHKDFKYYGGRGIKCLITVDELKKLWIMDKAYLMKRPSIDRKENDGDYTFNNCQYIELAKNTIKAHNKKIMQYNTKGKFIKKYNSIIEASICLKTTPGNIISVLKGRTCLAKGYDWRYAK